MYTWNAFVFRGEPECLDFLSKVSAHFFVCVCACVDSLSPCDMQEERQTKREDLVVYVFVSVCLFI